MLGYPQMEKYYQLLQVIEQYKARINQQHTGLHVQIYDGMPRSGYYEVDRAGSLLVDVEKMIGKLKLLEEKRDQLRPDVEATITILASGSGKNRIRTELIFTMHYLNGRELSEIAEILHMSERAVETAIMSRFDKFTEEL